jgi:pimeloyl-ACP methyl ester carboxylesterase
MARPIVLLHGYSSSADNLRPWRDALADRGFETKDIRLVDYISLSNEITIKDIAEGFDRALSEQAGLSAGEQFDVIVHSTGSLVIREWLVTYEGAARRVKHLIGLAPANFGSPMAHRGRSVMGAVIKGIHNDPSGPDFLEPGDRVLSGLELGSAYTWQLAHRDLLLPQEISGQDAARSKPIYSLDPDTPYPFVFIGLERYPFKSLVIPEAGYDGTVRWAGASLSTRKLTIDLTRAAEAADAAGEVRELPRASAEIPLVLVDGLNHGTIMREPQRLIDCVVEALAVDDRDGYLEWRERHPTLTAEQLEDPPERWQQFVVRVVDERGDPVQDYCITLGTGEGDDFEPIRGFSLDVHAFRDDPSYRCFHVNLDELPANVESRLRLRLVASTGTPYVTYYGAGHNRHEISPTDGYGFWTAEQTLETPDDLTFFYPYTTTLVEIRLNREPTIAVDPHDPAFGMRLVRFAEPGA